MNDRISVRRAVAALVRVAKTSKDSLTKLVKFYAEAINIKSAAYQAAEAQKNKVAEMMKGADEIKKMLADKVMEKDLEGKKNAVSVIQKIDAIAKLYESRISAAAQSLKGDEYVMENVINQIPMAFERITEEVTTGKERVKELDEEIEVMQDSINELKKERGQAMQAGEKTFKKEPSKMKVAFDRFKKAVSQRHKSLLKEQEQAEPEEAKPEEKKPEEKKPTAPAPKSSLNSWFRVSEEDMEGAAQALSDEIDALQEEVAEPLEMLAMSYTEPVKANAESALSIIQEMASAAPEEEAPAAEPAPEEEAPGKGIMDWFAPEPEMEMAPAAAGQESPWVERTADVKNFPSEHDLAGPAWELIESEEEGESKFVIRKDLKSKVDRKIRHLEKGAFRKKEHVAFDMGEFIDEGLIVEYLGESEYVIETEDGSKVKVAEANIFRPEERMWR